MEYTGSLIDCRNEVPAKAQRRKGRRSRCCCWTRPLFRVLFRLTLSCAPLRLCAMLFLLIAIAFTCFAQPRGAMRPADVVRVANVTDAQISPNGQFVVYTVSSVADDKTVSTLWIARLLPEIVPVQPTAQPTPLPRPGFYLDWPELRIAPRTLLPAGFSASTPRWSPASTSIAFLSEQ